ncbi:AAA family ATPase [Caldicellulosiruptoraceae bacterium PP1]
MGGGSSLDEYDVPIQQGYLSSYYDKVIEFMRNFFSSSLKDNQYLEKAVITGILRIAKESIFSGLNNLKVCSILNNQYSSYFGFLENEIIQLLEYYNIEHKADDIKKWYNGYSFGDKVIYNPWSILNFIDNNDLGFCPYWVNTAEETIIKNILARSDKELKNDLESLLTGQELKKPINENIVMGDIEKNTINIWSFLLFSGYLKFENKDIVNGRIFCSLKIPNEEVKILYQDVILSWFTDNINFERFNLQK